MFTGVGLNIHTVKRPPEVKFILAPIIFASPGVQLVKQPIVGVYGVILLLF